MFYIYILISLFFSNTLFSVENKTEIQDVTVLEGLDDLFFGKKSFIFSYLFAWSTLNNSAPLYGTVDKTHIEESYHTESEFKTVWGKYSNPTGFIGRQNSAAAYSCKLPQFISCCYLNEKYIPFSSVNWLISSLFESEKYRRYLEIELMYVKPTSENVISNNTNKFLGIADSAGTIDNFKKWAKPIKTTSELAPERFIGQGYSSVNYSNYIKNVVFSISFGDWKELSKEALIFIGVGYRFCYIFNNLSLIYYDLPNSTVQGPEVPLVLTTFNQQNDAKDITTHEVESSLTDIKTITISDESFYNGIFFSIGNELIFAKTAKDSFFLNSQIDFGVFYSKNKYKIDNLVGYNELYKGYNFNTYNLKEKTAFQTFPNNNSTVVADFIGATPEKTSGYIKTNTQLGRVSKSFVMRNMIMILLNLGVKHYATYIIEGTIGARFLYYSNANRFSFRSIPIQAGDLGFFATQIGIVIWS